MSETTTENTEETVETTDGAADQGTENAADDTEGTEALGDAGKQALDRMKARVKAAEQAKRDVESERDRLKAEAEGRAEEHQQELEAQKVKDAAIATANKKILKAEIRAAAAAKLADPTDALLHLDLDQFEVGEDGEVDTSSVTAAVDALLASKPYLAAQGGPRFPATADGGARKEKPLSVEEQITQAQKDGDNALARRLKAQQLIDIPVSQ